MRLASIVVTCAALGVGTGCSSAPAVGGLAGQSGNAAGRGGSGGRAGAGGAVAGASGTDAGTDAGSIDTAPETDGAAGASGGTGGGPAFTGRHSYVMTASLTSTPGNTGPVSVTSHRFTMVIDAAVASAIVGDVGSSSLVTFSMTSASTLSFAGPIRFSSGAGSSGWSVQYSQMTIAAAADGALTGTAQGTAYSYSAGTDVGQTATVTAALAGVPDAMAPVLTVARNGADDDPFSSLTVTASEPLPPDARPVLVVGGVSTPLELPSNASAGFVHDFYGPSKLLRYGQDYQVRVDGITDFAGLPASGGTAFTTRAAPPLVAEDGFESATGTMLGGAQLLTGPGAPTITGAHSLYLAPINSGFGPIVRPRTTRLALRLAVSPGDTVVRFAYRMVNPSAAGGGLSVYVASEGGKVAGTSIGSGTTTTTTATIPGQGDVTLGPAATAELALPPDVGSEVVVLESLTALNGGLPAPPTPGIIVDDLRVE